MGMIRYRWLWVGLVALLLFARMAAAEAGLVMGPRALIEQTTGEFLQAVANNREGILKDPDLAHRLVDEIVTPHIDVDATGRYMLGKHWRKGTPEQRDRFLYELRKMLVRSYANALAEYKAGDQINYISERVNDDGTLAVVRVQIPRPRTNQPADVAYRLHKTSGEWKVFDVTIEGVSMVTTYRSTFRVKLDRQGLDSVIEELAALNNKN
ncbi:MAG TPA: ABC transporter substrate-binding protein [Gammaproteobacteria bacterium]|nr:ABC transporter substrate-binding protein [Gammaproteobacteria bacterium]